MKALLEYMLSLLISSHSLSLSYVCLEGKGVFDANLKDKQIIEKQTNQEIPF